MPDFLDHLVAEASVDVTSTPELASAVASAADVAGHWIHPVPELAALGKLSARPLDLLHAVGA